MATSENFAKIKNWFSIKNFIPDLPRMLNEVLTVIHDHISKFYFPDENKIKCNKVESGIVEATTVITQNLSFKGSKGEIYNYDDLAHRIAELEKKVNC